MVHGPRDRRKDSRIGTVRVYPEFTLLSDAAGKSAFRFRHTWPSAALNISKGQA